MKKLLFLLTILVVIGCNDKKSNSDNEVALLKIDLRKTPSKKETDQFLNKISSIRLVPLETTEESVFSSQEILVEENYLFAIDYKGKSIIRFNMDGKFLNKIARYGQGPEEYTRVGKIAIYDNQVNLLQFHNIQQYDFEGNYIKTIPIETERGAYEMFLTPNNDFIVAGSFQDAYFFKMYNQNGLKVGEYFPARERYSGMQIERSATNILSWYNGGIYFCQYYDHTIYYLKDGEIKIWNII